MHRRFKHTTSASACRRPNQRGILRQAGGGFTLIELLVMIAVLAFGALMLAPALARTRTNSPAFQCMNNLSQLQRAFAMYAADNNGQFPANLGSLTYSTNAWCTGVLDWNMGLGGMPGQPGPNTNTFYLLNSALGPYTGRRASVYKCPSDKVPSNIGPRVRSYSMNGFVGGTVEADSFGYTAYRAYLKDSDLAAPGPTKTFVFIGEHPDSINDCLFAMHMPSTASWPAASSWDDVPASYHSGACGISSADGHVEIRRWLDATTVCPIQMTLPASATGKTSARDSRWLVSRASAPK